MTQLSRISPGVLGKEVWLTNTVRMWQHVSCSAAVSASFLVSLSLSVCTTKDSRCFVKCFRLKLFAWYCRQIFCLVLKQKNEESLDVLLSVVVHHSSVESLHFPKKRPPPPKNRKKGNSNTSCSHLSDACDSKSFLISGRCLAMS